MPADPESCSGRCCTSANTARRSFWGLRRANTFHGVFEERRISHDHEMCRKILSKPSNRSMAATFSGSSGTTCCHESGGHLTNATESEMSDCSGRNCDHGKNSYQSNRLGSPNKLQDQITHTASITEVDPDECLTNVKHIILGVQGMDCTSCEEKLRRAISSIPDISNIKVSQLLSRAEFHLVESVAYNGGNIPGIVRSRTGFKCTRILPTGAKLHLIVEGDAERFLRNYPHGVTDVSIVKENIVVCYQPRIIGARALLSTPFFLGAKLAPLPPSREVTTNKAQLFETACKTLASALLTIPVLVLAYAPLPEHKLLYGAISLVLATIVQFAIAGSFYLNAFKSLFYTGMVEMDMLVVLSTSAAYIYSVIAFAYQTSGHPLSIGEFFETSTLLVTLILIGKTVSALAHQKAMESISMETLQAPTAIVVDPLSLKEREIDARLLEYDDVFTIHPDTSVVTDGLILTGESEVDESMITGEADYVHKSPGMSVVAGSVNHSGTLSAKVTRLPYENTIKLVGSMVDEAKSSKPKIQVIADRVAGHFVPAVLCITAVVFIIWVSIEKAIHHHSTGTACITAMTYAISSLIVSCPCAIGLAVPMVVAVAGGVGARHGLILKSAETIEIARKVSHVIFDKTGTLTQGKLSVVAGEFPKGGSDILSSIILGATINSKHPVSVAIANHLSALGLEPAQLEDVVSIPGKGILARTSGAAIRAGNPYWLGVEGTISVRKNLELGLSIFCVTIDRELVATFGLKDQLRPDALETVKELGRRSIAVSLISGDNEAAVHAISTQLNIPSSRTRPRCTPTDKQQYVQGLLQSGENVVLFCGDGTNDAVALAQADIGVHMNEGTDVAQSAADAILMRPSLRRILTLIDLSNAFYRRVVFNFAWSFLYNSFAVLLAAGAFPYARIAPRYAGLGEIMSVVPVVLAAMQLRWAGL